MSVISTIRRWVNMIFKTKAKELFDVKSVTPAELDNFIIRCANIYKGNPFWLEDSKRTINFAKSISSETARLTTLGISVNIDGGAMGEYLTKQFEDFVYFNLRHWVEFGCAYGTIILKPNGESVDVVTPKRFIVTNHNNGNITGAVFINQETVDKKYYTRLEYHRFNEDSYLITNYVFKAEQENDLGRQINIEDSPWSMLEAETTVDNITKPLFAVLRTPMANNIDIDSPLGLPVYAEALQELRDLDIAYTINSQEIEDSERTILVDDSLLMTAGKNAKKIKMPRIVREVFGDGSKQFYQEINPTLNTAERLVGINALLSEIGYKCGFSNGYFVFNERQGVQTATGVEAEQQRTIQFVKDMRDKLESCLNDLFNAMAVFGSFYGDISDSEYEVTYSFGDITYNYEEDRARWWGYVLSGKVPAWRFFNKFEGMTEDEAKAMIEEAMPTQDMDMMLEEE